MSNSNQDLEIDATEIRIRAERKLGEIVAKTEKAKGTKGLGRPALGGRRQRPPKKAVPTLAEMGISKDVSSRAQKLAAVPAEVFEAKIAEAKEATKELGFTTFAGRMTRWRLIFEGM